jgi:hypothetical protein
MSDIFCLPKNARRFIANPRNLLDTEKLDKNKLEKLSQVAYILCLPYPFKGEGTKTERFVQIPWRIMFFDSLRL